MQKSIKGYFLDKDQRTGELIKEGVEVKGTLEEIAYKIIIGEKKRGAKFLKTPLNPYEQRR